MKKVGIIGCGNISGAYLTHAAMFEAFDVVAVADLDLDRAKARAQEFNIARACSVDELLALDEVDLVINLTVPAAHGDLGLKALSAGKHVYNEKPLSIELAEAKAMLELARSNGLRVGCAPDTFLGAGLQTARAFVDSGSLGQPVGAHAMMVSNGPEKWHPDPEFFFKRGAGPLFDMGPYYITALVNFFGPIKRVSAFARATFAERTIGSGPKAGQKIKVETPTHIAAVLEFASGPLANLTMSFDAVGGTAPNIELYGSEGSLLVNDPNNFTGHLKTRHGKGPWGSGDWSDVPVTRPYSENSRGIGVADMIYAIEHNRPHRASGDLAYHALETMHSILQAADEGKAITLESTVERPAALPEGDTEAILK
jgi:predicted dehydrogenase